MSGWMVEEDGWGEFEAMIKITWNSGNVTQENVKVLPPPSPGKKAKVEKKKINKQGGTEEKPLGELGQT